MYYYMYKDHNRKYEHNNYNCYYTISKQSNIYIYTLYYNKYHGKYS